MTQQNKKRIKFIFFVVLFFIATFCVATATIGYVYNRDKNKYEPKLWIGFFDYRLNFRDLGSSLNQCLTPPSVG